MITISDKMLCNLSTQSRLSASRLPLFVFRPNIIAYLHPLHFFDICASFDFVFPVSSHICIPCIFDVCVSLDFSRLPLFVFHPSIIAYLHSLHFSIFVPLLILYSQYHRILAFLAFFDICAFFHFLFCLPCFHFF